MLKWSYHFENWQAARQQCCRDSYQISELLENSKRGSCAFETLQDLEIRRLMLYIFKSAQANSLGCQGIVINVMSNVTSPWPCSYHSMGATHRLCLTNYHTLRFNLLSYSRNPVANQLERLRSEDTPRRLMITHTIESYWIPSQKMTKSSYKF